MKPFFLLLVLFVSVVAGAADRAIVGQKKTAEIGGVNMSAALLGPAEREAATIDFQIVMDTHSGALPSDMLASAKLIGEGGAEITPLAWSGGKGGHHLSGKLSFPAAGSEKLAVLTLVLKNVGGRSDARFEWNIPSKSVKNTGGGAG
jgi:hypothetical protein